MGKLLQKFLGCSLALAVLLAGAIGISPVLHVLIEHGGASTAHTHFGAKVSYSHTHSRLPAAAAAVKPLKPLRLQTAPPLTLFGLQPQSLFRSAARLASGLLHSIPAPPDGTDSSHTHHSLAQMLLSGAVEFSLDVPAVSPVCPSEQFAATPSTTVVRSFEWQAQTASRAPPLRA